MLFHTIDIHYPLTHLLSPEIPFFYICFNRKIKHWPVQWKKAPKVAPPVRGNTLSIISLAINRNIILNKTFIPYSKTKQQSRPSSDTREELLCSIYSWDLYKVLIASKILFQSEITLLVCMYQILTSDKLSLVGEKLLIIWTLKHTP